MPLSAHFLAVTPDGCPEEIEAGPFTEERAKDALFAWEMNHGCPARVVCLGEVVEPVAFLTIWEPGGSFEHVGVRGSLEEALADAATKHTHDTVQIFGLVPAKG